MPSLEVQTALCGLPGRDRAREADVTSDAHRVERHANLAVRHDPAEARHGLRVRLEAVQPALPRRPSTRTLQLLETSPAHSRR